MFLRTLGVLLLGVYIGQEYNDIPKINRLSSNVVTLISNTELYNMLSRDLKKINEDKKKDNKGGWF